jgi:hypothetical protein
MPSFIKNLKPKGLPLMILTFFFFTFIPLHSRTYTGYERMKNRKYGYSILVPSEWKKTVAELPEKTITLLRKGDSSEIAITASEATDSEIKKWNTWRDWYMKDRGLLQQEIVEKKDVPIHGNARGRILLLEYTQRGERILQKVLIVRNKSLLLIVECRSTLNLYYRYSEIFENVSGSIIFAEGESGGTKNPEEEKKTGPANNKK